MNPIQHQGDALVFAEDVAGYQKEEDSEHGVWNLLIIDDDPDVHSATMFALNGIMILGRRLKFLHAYSVAEARHVLIHTQDLAVILLDVVMDDTDAGLQLISYIRDTLDLLEVRIILRTGQAGYAPEMEAIRNFDINDYKNKTELTQTKLFTSVTTAIRSYDQIRRISAGKQGLEFIIRASNELMGIANLQSFSKKIIAHAMSLIGVDAEAFVCSTHGLHEQSSVHAENLDGLRVIAPTNRYVTWDEQALVQVADKSTQNLIQRALFLRQHQFDERASVLYFGSLEGIKLAIYFDAATNPASFDFNLLDLFCNNVSVCLENVILTSCMHNLAYFDPLTGLANRLQLLQSLNETLHSNKKNESALALIDIDHFAETNDAFGHQFGDALLREIAKRLRMHFNENCSIARIGNDIFAIVGHEEIVLPEMILGLFSSSYFVEKQGVQLSATLGLVRFSEYESSASEALKDANIALKRAKQHQRSGHAYFTREMGVDIRERVHMMHALRAAFEAKRLFIVYQPQVNMLTGQATGAEALLRWKSEQGNFIPPDQFIPIAEYSGLIINIGEWVLRSACFELVKLRQQGFTKFQMAVNVSQAQFSHPHFLQSVERALRDSQAPPQCIELEITESMAMADPEQITTILHKIKSLGIRISIDDFGTGFSSLSQLQKLNVDKLKIDRAFVNEISQGFTEGSIAKMIVQLSQSLKLEVIAEGVETQAQADALMSFGCDLAQGFFFARPQISRDLLVWLQLQAIGPS